MAPTYVYQCEKCKISEELFCSMSAKPSIITCKKCGGKARTIIQPANFHLGDGAWASNGYSSTPDFGKIDKKKR